MDHPKKEITSTHIFSTKQQRQYPQTRRVVYTPQKGRLKAGMSSATSPLFIDGTDDELDGIHRNGSTTTFSARSTPHSNYEKIVQEVSLAYSAPLTIYPTEKEIPITVQVSNGNAFDEYGRAESSSLQEYLSDYEARVNRQAQDSRTHHNNTRQETEFSVRGAYVGGETPFAVPVASYPARHLDSRASTQRIGSALSESIISETTTIEELTTITTTNRRSASDLQQQQQQQQQHQEEEDEEMQSPGSVGALTQQFEQTARRQSQDSNREQRVKSPLSHRVTVVSKPGPEVVYSAEDSRVRRFDQPSYSPKGFVSTTIVDIEPPGYRARSTTPRFIEERYEVQEEFRTVKTYSKPSDGTRSLDRREVRSSAADKRNANSGLQESVRERVVISRSSSRERERENERELISREQEREERAAPTPVRSVVEQYESKLGARDRKSPDSGPHVKAFSYEEYTLQRRENPEPPTRAIPKVEIPTSRPSPVTKEVREVVEITRQVPRRPPTPPRTPELPLSRTPEIPFSRTPEVPRAELTPPPTTEWEMMKTVETVREKKSEKAKEEQKVPVAEKKYEERRQETRKEVERDVVIPPTQPKTDVTRNRTDRTMNVWEEVTTSRTTRPREDQLPRFEPRPSPQPDRMSTVTSSYSSHHHVSGGAGRSVKLSGEYGSASLSGLSPYGQNAAATIRDVREREKREMSDLNDRLASYIEKVRFLEAQNRKLANDLDTLNSRWGSETSSVRVMYESEIKTATSLVEDSNRQRDALDVEIRRLVTELSEWRTKYEESIEVRNAARFDGDGLLKKLAEVEAEILLIKRRIQVIDEELARIKRENMRLIGEIAKYRSSIEHETASRLDFQNQVSTLLEEVQYVSRVHTTELGDLVVMAHRDTTPENREYFRAELAAAIRDIRVEYEQISQSTRVDMESWYRHKVQEIHFETNKSSQQNSYQREELKRLRVTLTETRTRMADLEGRNLMLEKQIQELNYQLEEDQRSYESALNDKDVSIRTTREECQALMVELQMLLDTKTTLDAEIAIYRKMLEGEENRAGLRQLVDQVVRTNYTSSNSVDRVVRREVSSSSNYQRSALGNVSIHGGSSIGAHLSSGVGLGGRVSGGGSASYSAAYSSSTGAAISSH